MAAQFSNKELGEFEAKLRERSGRRPTSSSGHQRSQSELVVTFAALQSSYAAINRIIVTARPLTGSSEGEIIKPIRIAENGENPPMDSKRKYTGEAWSLRDTDTAGVRG